MVYVSDNSKERERPFVVYRLNVVLIKKERERPFIVYRLIVVLIKKERLLFVVFRCIIQNGENDQRSF